MSAKPESPAPDPASPAGAPIGPSPKQERAKQVLLDESFRILVQGVKDYAIFMLDPDGRVVCWNTGAELIFGYSEADVVGRHYSLFFTPDDASLGEPGRELAVARTFGRFEGRGQRVRLGGSPFLAEIVIATVRGQPAGQLLGFSQITRDITEKVRLEEQLRQSQKMEAIGTLSAGVAHDFNNLLTVINGYAAVLLGTLHDQDPAREPVAEIGKAGDRAALLTRQLLAFSRKQILAPQVLDLNARVTDSLSLVRRLVGPTVEVTTKLDPKLWSVEADPGQLEQILLNLAVNSRDAMSAPHNGGKGGRLTFGTANVELRPPAPDGVRPGRCVVLSVSDTGCGMDAEVLARIFEPFFTTKPVGVGTGLGLSTVYGAVKQSGGHVEAESAGGGGTPIRVYLPSAEGAPPTPKAQAYLSEVRGGPETLLLVEDEDGIRNLGVYLLQKGGYTVLAASGGAEAVEVGTQFEGKIDLLVTDVVMPGTTGLQAAARLSALRPGLKVLYMSGYSEDAVASQGLLGPGTPFLQKSFTPTALARKVREVLDS